MAVLTGLLLLGAVYACQNTTQFVANMQVCRGVGWRVWGWVRSVVWLVD
jgi:hypothetical protein